MSELRNRKPQNKGSEKAPQNEDLQKQASNKDEGRGIRMAIMLLLTTVTATAAYFSQGKVPSIAGERSAQKPFTGVQEFYPFYLTQHQDPTCKLLHVIGTTIVLLSGSVSPTMYLSGLFAGSIGYIAAEALCALDNGFVEFGILLVCFLASTKFLTGNFNWFVLVVGYGFAWVGHFFYEKNQPATFIYPTYSLMSDIHLFFDVLTQRVSISPVQ